MQTFLVQNSSNDIRHHVIVHQNISKKYFFFFCETNFFFANKSFLVTFFQPIGLYNGKYEWASRPGSGDCSLNIMAVDIKFDDGLWECQVTASSFESQDALASKPARLVVRGTNGFYFFFQSTDLGILIGIFDYDYDTVWKFRNFPGSLIFT